MLGFARTLREVTTGLSTLGLQHMAAELRRSDEDGLAIGDRDEIQDPIILLRRLDYLERFANKNAAEATSLLRTLRIAATRAVEAKMGRPPARSDLPEIVTHFEP